MCDSVRMCAVFFFCSFRNFSHCAKAWSIDRFLTNCEIFPPINTYVSVVRGQLKYTCIKLWSYWFFDRANKCHCSLKLNRGWKMLLLYILLLCQLAINCVKLILLSSFGVDPRKITLTQSDPQSSNFAHTIKQKLFKSREFTHKSERFTIARWLDCKCFGMITQR